VYRERGTHSPKQKFARQKIYNPKIIIIIKLNKN